MIVISIAFFSIILIFTWYTITIWWRPFGISSPIFLSFSVFLEIHIQFSYQSKWTSLWLWCCTNLIPRHSFSSTCWIFVTWNPFLDPIPQLLLSSVPGVISFAFSSYIINSQWHIIQLDNVSRKTFHTNCPIYPSRWSLCSWKYSSIIFSIFQFGCINIFFCCGYCFHDLYKFWNNTLVYFEFYIIFLSCPNFSIIRNMALLLVTPL